MSDGKGEPGTNIAMSPSVDRPATNIRLQTLAFSMETYVN